MKRVSLRMDDARHEMLRRYAAFKGLSVHRVIMDAIDEDLDRNAGKIVAHVYHGIMRDIKAKAKSKAKGGR